MKFSWRGNNVHKMFSKVVHLSEMSSVSQTDVP